MLFGSFPPGFFLGFLFGCGGTYESSRDTIVDGVKLLAPSISDGADTNSYWQKEYKIGPKRRLLLRREDLITRKSSLRVDAEHPVVLSVSLLDTAETTDALADLKLCWLQKNWMMLATWKLAHPFDSSGRWDSAGGDYAEETCVSPTQDDTITERLNFDVSDHVQTRLIGLSEAYGWVLLNSVLKITIAGEKNASLFPRIKWSELVVVEPGLRAGSSL